MCLWFSSHLSFVLHLGLQGNDVETPQILHFHLCLSGLCGLSPEEEQHVDHSGRGGELL